MKRTGRVLLQHLTICPSANLLLRISVSSTENKILS